MARYPKVFSPVDVMVVAAADASGNLAECLKLLSSWHDFFDRLKHMFVSKMMLPLLLIFLVSILEAAPALFSGKINIHQYLVRMVSIQLIFYGPIVIIIAIARLTPQKGFFRRLLDGVILLVPVLRKAVKELAISRYCNVFYMLFKAGVPIIQCAQQASEYTGNAFVTDMFAGGAKSALAGNLVSEGFSAGLDQNFMACWQIGEESGELDNVVARLAKSSSETAERLFIELGKWVPKLLYFAVSLYIAASVFKGYATLHG